MIGAVLCDSVGNECEYDNVIDLSLALGFLLSESLSIFLVILCDFNFCEFLVFVVDQIKNFNSRFQSRSSLRIPSYQSLDRFMLTLIAFRRYFPWNRFIAL